MARISPIPFFQRAGALYVEIIRNTPLTVVFFMIVFVLPQIGITIPSYTLCAIITLGIYTAAFVSEAVRAGINTVGRGQAEASRALGLSFLEGMRFIIVPQAIRAVVPPMANVWIALVKNTSVAAGFGVLELTASGQRINFLDPSSVITALLWIALAYLVITLGSAFGFRVLEKRMAIAR
ncbi:MAG: amino acid ABC transporter permease [Comamonadaceae bacterium]|nr:MAG: amino acid ABC transporter permease [Comamonadaceae bacterium]